MVHDQPIGGGVAWRERQVMDPAAEVGPHTPLPFGSHEDDVYCFLDVLLTSRELYAAARAWTQGESPPAADYRVPGDAALHDSYLMAL